jgi:hypothetical protein
MLAARKTYKYQKSHKKNQPPQKKPHIITWNLNEILNLFGLNILHKRMDPPGFEPGASALQGRRSPRLSYGPI